MALNVERLLEELRFVTIHPDKHDQGLWAEAKTEVEIPEDTHATQVTGPRPSACGSFGCLAGNTAIHEPGVELAWYEATYRREGHKKITVWQAENIVDEFVTVKDTWDGTEYTEAKPISQKAREILDLTGYQADLLFDAENDLDRLWELAEQFTGGEISANKFNSWDDNSYGRALADKKTLEEEKAK